MVIIPSNFGALVEIDGKSYVRSGIEPRPWVDMDGNRYGDDDIIRLGIWGTVSIQHGGVKRQPAEPDAIGTVVWTNPHQESHKSQVFTRVRKSDHGRDWVNTHGTWAAWRDLARVNDLDVMHDGWQ